MNDTKKTRPMTAKRFISATYSGKTTAEGFLAAHWSFLQNHTFLHPILEAYEKKELLPTPTIQACQQALLTHLLASEKVKSDAAIAKKKEQANAPKVIKRGDKQVKSSVPTGKYTVTLMCKVYDREGNVTIQVGTVEKKKFREVEKNGNKVLEPYTEVSPAVWAAETYNDANRLADRRLLNREDSVYAIIENTMDRPIQTMIQRDDAIARMLKQPKGPASRAKGTSTKTLKWQAKAKNDRASFSRG